MTFLAWVLVQTMSSEGKQWFGAYEPGYSPGMLVLVVDQMPKINAKEVAAMAIMGMRKSWLEE